MRFSKYHALGNDYLVLEPGDAPDFFSPDQVRAICHRHYGLGSDGILYGPLPTAGADFGLQIWNPDGSQAEKSGNGLRIFARHLLATGRVKEEPFTVETPGGVVACQVSDGGVSIRVEMGRVSFDAAAIPVLGETGEVLDRAWEVGGEALRFAAATIGNPHVVVLTGPVNPERTRRLGPLIENATGLFPKRTNVQFLQVRDRRNLQIEIWERGAGYTLASGSSSSAAAAVARRLDLCDADVTVHCPGGAIGISIDPEFRITMTGPATPVGTYELAPGVADQQLPPGA